MSLTDQIDRLYNNPDEIKELSDEERTELLPALLDKCKKEEERIQKNVKEFECKKKEQLRTNNIHLGENKEKFKENLKKETISQFNNEFNELFRIFSAI